MTGMSLTTPPAAQDASSEDIICLLGIPLHEGTLTYIYEAAQSVTSVRHTNPNQTNLQRNQRISNKNVLPSKYPIYCLHYPHVFHSSSPLSSPNTSSGVFIMERVSSVRNIFSNNINSISSSSTPQT